MSTVPDVSVVIGAYNAAGDLARTLDSVLRQAGVDFEVIVVNDGSRDATGSLLDEIARRDPRVRPIHQENRGLTQALIRGCAEARGEFIARQDIGDVSLPGRLLAQLSRAQASDRPVLVAVGCHCLSPDGESMYEVAPPEDTERARSRILVDGQALCHHGAILFRRDTYEQVGGYRAAFYYAQDIDLILRLAERGAVVGIARRLYEFEFAPLGISGVHSRSQRRFYDLARATQHARAAGRDEDSLLRLAEAHRLKCLASRGKGGPGNPARGLFFIASCLRSRDPQRARHYYRLAWRHRPLSPRYLARYLQSLIFARRTP
jgi:glycosyltransferase involved in cell wall biosynthesis